MSNPVVVCRLYEPRRFFDKIERRWSELSFIDPPPQAGVDALREMLIEYRDQINTVIGELDAPDDPFNWL